MWLLRRCIQDHWACEVLNITSYGAWDLRQCESPIVVDGVVVVRCRGAKFRIGYLPWTPLFSSLGQKLLLSKFLSLKRSRTCRLSIITEFSFYVEWGKTCDCKVWYLLEENWRTSVAVLALGTLRWQHKRPVSKSRAVYSVKVSRRFDYQKSLFITITSLQVPNL
jgi:hypothetical protein